MARKHSKGKKRIKVIEVEEIPDDGIPESEVVVTPEDLKAAREANVESMQQEQGNVEVSAGAASIRNLYLIDEDDDIQNLGASAEAEEIVQEEKEEVGNPVQDEEIVIESVAREEPLDQNMEEEVVDTPVGEQPEKEQSGKEDQAHYDLERKRKGK